MASACHFGRSKIASVRMHLQSSFSVPVMEQFGIITSGIGVKCLPFWRRNMESAGGLRREYGTKSSQIRVQAWRMDSDRSVVHEFENFLHRNPSPEVEKSSPTLDAPPTSDVA